MIGQLLAFRIRRGFQRLDLPGWLALSVLVVISLAALFGPLSGYQPGMDVDISQANRGPGPGHWLGTDHLGRDTFWRLVLACRAFAFPGALACAVVTFGGTLLGAIAGARPSWAATAARYLAEVIGSIPRFVLVLLALAIYGNDPWILGISAGIAYLPALVEDLRARLHRLGDDGYLQASEAHGLSSARALWVHGVIGAAGGLLARHMLGVFAFVVVLETTLSYLGDLGVQEPTPSWGNMLVFEWGRSGSLVSRSAPAVALWITVLSLTSLAARVEEVPGD